MAQCAHCEKEATITGADDMLNCGSEKCLQKARESLAKNAVSSIAAADPDRSYSLLLPKDKEDQPDG